MRVRFIGLFILLSVFICSGSAVASPTIEGSLADWNMGFAPDWYPPNDWVPSDPNISYELDPDSGWYLGPGYGGQPFDAEAMYAFYSTPDGYLYVAVVTGMPPTGSTNDGTRYMPGDIAIDFGQDESYEIGVGVPTTETTGGTSNVILNPDWTNPTFTQFIDDSAPVSMVGGTGTDTGSDAQIAYNNNYYGSYHYVIELAIPIASFGDLWGDPFTIHWTMDCGNDVLDLKVSSPPVVPEPSTALLFGVGLIGLALNRVRRLIPA
ncbi:MAG: PEP-CTERM sorting domain-containing protein [Candidatus Abyssobacteria bacterium SURF_17]|uniref:PEP-CTERM sorting domain-containing protein n=1 Tax=Candidatus Abyssobacteria bacterium SURF_17 TaxID=2093361 RepID=A0A419F2D9_9BACT|nr:MAG: PEP-CTERM sorting domain-containing protein [Candidatus Abyssubacteria bacterium SURF_17]